MIIGLHGKPGSGKDAVADYLVSDRQWVKIAFADLLKEELCAAYEVCREIFDLRELKTVKLEMLRLGACMDEDFIAYAKSQVAPEEACFIEPDHRSPRELMQMYGDYRRADDRNYFISAAIAKALYFTQSDINVVVTDVRYENEMYAIQAIGGKVVEVFRPNNPYAADLNGHSSNQALPPREIAAVIGNTGTLSDLYNTTDDVLKRFKK